MKKAIWVFCWIMGSLISGLILNIGAFETSIIAFGIPLLIVWYLSYVTALWKSANAIRMMKDLPLSPANISKMLANLNKLKQRKPKEKKEEEKEEDKSYGNMYR